MHISRITPLYFRGNLIVKVDQDKTAKIDPSDVRTIKPYDINEGPYKGIIIECERGTRYSLSSGDYYTLQALVNMNLIKARDSSEDVEFKNIDDSVIEDKFSVKK